MICSLALEPSEVGPGSPLDIVAVGAAGVATGKRIAGGDSKTDILLSGTGPIPGLGGAAAGAASNVARTNARLTGTLTRGTGGALRAVSRSIAVWEDLTWIPPTYGGLGRSALCGGLF